MKKVLVFFFVLLFLTGCTSVQNDSIDNILKSGMTSNINVTNMTRTGYKYYLPKGLKNITSEDYNEVFYSEKYAYYLYVDVVSYFNKVKESYTESKNFYYSKKLTNNEQFGYLQVKRQENDKYFVEIMYNYAKIEVIVAENDIKEVVAYAMAILNSIHYNDTVLGSLMGDNILNSNEFTYNIFETAKSESNYLESQEQNEGKEDSQLPDTDLIK